MSIVSCIERTPPENHMFAAVDGGAICNRCQLFVLTKSSVVQENILIEIKHELNLISKRTRKIKYRSTYSDLNPWLDIVLLPE
jgi:hypothetical protein